MRVITGVILMFVGGLVAGVSTPVFAESPSLLIVAVQTGSQTSASQEYIELANISSQTVDLSPVRLQYFSASAKDLVTASRTIVLQGSLEPGQRHTMASTGYMADQQIDQTFSATLAAAGGHLKLARNGQAIDTVAWGTAIHPLGQAASAPSPGQRLLRQQDVNGDFLVSNNNYQDFTHQTATTSIPASGIVNGALLVELSELLPNPASPDTDATGEYIELVNNHTEVAQLAGLKLVVGSNLNLSNGKSYTLTDTTLQPGEHKALYITETKLTLGNSGSTVQLQSATGEILSQTSYDVAKVGQAWSYDGTAWQWTTSPTPSAANILATIATPSTASKSSAATKKKAAATKTTSKKGQVKAASTKQAKQAKQPAEEPPKPKLHNTVVAGVGGLAVLYGAYEYRQDVTSLYRKLRGNRKAG